MKQGDGMDSMYAFHVFPALSAWSARLDADTQHVVQSLVMPNVAAPESAR
jgi:hypothetical protein